VRLAAGFWADEDEAASAAAAAVFFAAARRRGGFGSSESAIGYLIFPEPAWPR
jgi:hypothetical protein